MIDTCPKCSASLDEDANFCPSCSAPVNPQCPKCEKPVGLDAKFCKYCAFDLTQKVADDEKQSIEPASQPVKSKPEYTGVDALLSEKYSAMSDFQLLTMLKGDLSAQTPKSLSIALAELEARPKIDWREMNIAKTRITEAIAGTNKPKGFGAPFPASHYKVSEDAQGEKADKLVKSGGITAGISALAFFWGVSYTNNTANQLRAGFGSLVGQTDSTYAFAKLCVILGLIGVIVGIVLLIVGFSQRNTR